MVDGKTGVVGRCTPLVQGAVGKERRSTSDRDTARTPPLRMGEAVATVAQWNIDTGRVLTNIVQVSVSVSLSLSLSLSLSRQLIDLSNNPFIDPPICLPYFISSFVHSFLSFLFCILIHDILSCIN